MLQNLSFWILVANGEPTLQQHSTDKKKNQGLFFLDINTLEMRCQGVYRLPSSNMNILTRECGVTSSGTWGTGGCHGGTPNLWTTKSYLEEEVWKHRLAYKSQPTLRPGGALVTKKSSAELAKQQLTNCFWGRWIEKCAERAPWGSVVYITEYSSMFELNTRL